MLSRTYQAEPGSSYGFASTDPSPCIPSTTSQTSVPRSSFQFAISFKEADKEGD
jgi:hypothetical protein